VRPHEDRAAAEKRAEDLASRIREAFPQGSPRRIRLPSDRVIVFIGDIHGDVDAVKRILDRFPVAQHRLVFLGDVVDRGPDSYGALAALVEAKLSAPTCVHLLMGNHEAWGAMPFQQADFWQSLPPRSVSSIAEALLCLPYMAWHPSGLAAVHGALPDVSSWDEIEEIRPGTAPWTAMTWGDWVAEDREVGKVRGRPSWGPSAFTRRTARLEICVLIRAHQLAAPLRMYEDRCLTLFSSCACGAVRQVARWDPCRYPRTSRDLDLIEI
jgi:hypothetical protein